MLAFQTTGMIPRCPLAELLAALVSFLPTLLPNAAEQVTLRTGHSPKPKNSAMPSAATIRQPVTDSWPWVRTAELVDGV
jgi:hypothetical protein